jgi:hypothetical protein
VDDGSTAPAVVRGSSVTCGTALQVHRGYVCGCTALLNQAELPLGQDTLLVRRWQQELIDPYHAGAVGHKNRLGRPGAHPVHGPAPLPLQPSMIIGSGSGGNDSSAAIPYDR